MRYSYKLILIPAMPDALVGFLISYALTSNYNSQSLILVEGQKFG